MIVSRKARNNYWHNFKGHYSRLSGPANVGRFYWVNSGSHSLYCFNDRLHLDIGLSYLWHVNDKELNKFKTNRRYL